MRIEYDYKLAGRLYTVSYKQGGKGASGKLQSLDALAKRARLYALDRLKRKHGRNATLVAVRVLK